MSFNERYDDKFWQCIRTFRSGKCTKRNSTKGLYLTRPSIGQYFTNRKELQVGANEIFEKIKFGKIKIKIAKKYKLKDAKQAHTDLEARKITGPAILIP